LQNLPVILTSPNDKKIKKNDIFPLQDSQGGSEIAGRLIKKDKGCIVRECITKMHWLKRNLENNIA
jgi:hypothetical protein